jgi:outer membrane protease
MSRFSRYKGLGPGCLYIQCALALFFFLSVASLCPAAEKKDESVQLTKYLSIGVKVERLVNSHTSYEFGNPGPPYQVPLSRLEFPLDSWWGGLELRFCASRFSVGGEALTNILGDTAGRMKDSDWDDDSNPKVMSVYSESMNRMRRSYRTSFDADLEIADWIGLPKWISLRPVAGFRYQSFHLVAHDGVQQVLNDGSPPQSLPGDAIRFKQQYWQYFGGIRSQADVGRYVGLSDLKLSLQFDWAYVDGNNEDLHLLREGRRFTYEITSGYAWHGSVGLKKNLIKNLYLGLEVDYLKIVTKGNHRWVNEPFNMDEKSFHGVKVWSEQTGIGLTLEYRF